MRTWNALHGVRGILRGGATLSGVFFLAGFAAGSVSADPGPFRIVDDPLYSGSGVISNERFIDVEGTTTVLATWNEEAFGDRLAYYGVSLDGRSFARVTSTTYELGLLYSSFDPLINVPEVAPELSAGDDVNLYVVQFVTQPLETFQEKIEALGGAVHHYVAQLAYLVEMTPEVREQVATFPYVRWIGAYEPAYRLEDYMLDNLESAASVYPRLRYNIQVHRVEQKRIVADRITTIGATVEWDDAGKLLIEATLTPSELFQVVRWDEVLFVDRWSEYETDVNIARRIGGARYLENIAGYSGDGVRGESFDTGFNLSHVDHQANPLIIHGPSVLTDDHGASTIGICFGDGTGFRLARGLLPDGQPIIASSSVIGLTGSNRYTHTGELVEEPYNAVFQTSSVGSARTLNYSTVSANTDQALFDFDIVHCQSQSNAGDQDSRPQAWAKNIISGGGVFHYNTFDKSDDCWCGGASIGPAADGRVKPTFTHFYDRITTTSCCGDSSYTGSFGGTSGATPIICGYVGLFFQLWSDGVFGNPVDPTGTVFENRAHMTTAKAMLVNTADQYNFAGTADDLTRMHQGWGMPDLRKAYDNRDNVLVIDESDVLAPFGSTSYAVPIAAGTPELKATMVYADTPGNPAVQSQHRINDLNLKVTSPSGMEFHGNEGLLVGVWSTPGGTPDDKNTVENVFVEFPEEGTWIVEVSAPEVITDTHVETPALDADYALVVSGTASATDAPIASPGPPAGDLTLRIQGLSPSSGEARLSFHLGSNALVKLDLYDVSGRVIATVYEGALPAGEHRLAWDGHDRNGQPAAAGVYFARLHAGRKSTTGKVVVVR